MLLTLRTRLLFLGILVLVGPPGPATAAASRQSSTAPVHLRVTATTATTIRVSWSAPKAGRAVAGYGVYRGGRLIAQTRATSYSYGRLSCETTYRMGIDARNQRNRRSAVTSITARTRPCPASKGKPTSSTPYPASYYSGPLGRRNILPPKHPGAFLGIWDTGMQQALDRESAIGRRFDILTARYNASAGRCYNHVPLADGKSRQQVAHGAIPLVGWSPGFTLEEINAGAADACFRDVARRVKAFRHRLFLFAYHEHNGFWMRYSGCGHRFISAWRRTVSIFRREGVNNVAWVWGPSEGYRTCAFESYPGDEWVDWVSPGGYNHNRSDVWCGYRTGWCEFWETFRFDPKLSLHDRYGPRKPIMFNEIGTVEDPAVPGRKGEWFRLARDRMKSDFPYGKGLVYFDAVYSDGDWRIDTSDSSLQGFRDLARDPHFRTSR